MYAGDAACFLIKKIQKKQITDKKSDILKESFLAPCPRVTGIVIRIIVII